MNYPFKYCISNGFRSRITNNAAYIESWLSALQDDKKFAIMAASKAQRAANYVLELVAESSCQDVNEPFILWYDLVRV